VLKFLQVTWQGEEVNIHIVFEYDTERNIVFTEDYGELSTREDVDKFFSEYRKFFEGLDKKTYMVSNIDNLLVHAPISDYYGEVARNTVVEYVSGFARWGTNDRARMTVRTTSLKANIPQNIYRTKEEAIQAIEKMRGKNEEPDV